jgi:ABC-type uncharacterized transport system permease subunit
MKNNYYFNDLVGRIDDTLMEFPITFFKEIRFIFIFYIFPVIYYSSIITDFVFGYTNINDLFLSFLILLSLIAIFAIGIFVLWHYGLKRYEAYG